MRNLPWGCKAGANRTNSRDRQVEFPVTLQPYENKTLAVAQSSLECGRIAAPHAAYRSRAVRFILRCEESAGMHLTNLYSYSCANHHRAKPVANCGIQKVYDCFRG